MSMGRLYRGVVRVVTEEGPYYLRPQMRERLRLLWMFRHFSVLPSVVLKQSELEVIGRLSKNSYAPQMELSDELIGTLDFRPPLRKSVQSEFRLQMPSRTA